MESEKPLVDKQIILDLLYGDENYVKEFAAASVESFSEFKNNFEQSVLNKDMETLRKTGHKIKPVAMMMKLDAILEMYERSKEYIEHEEPDSKLEAVTDEMNQYCGRLLNELKVLAD